MVEALSKGPAERHPSLVLSPGREDLTECWSILVDILGWIGDTDPCKEYSSHTCLYKAYLCELTYLNK